MDEPQIKDQVMQRLTEALQEIHSRLDRHFLIITNLIQISKEQDAKLDQMAEWLEGLERKVKHDEIMAFNGKANTIQWGCECHAQ